MSGSSRDRASKQRWNRSICIRPDPDPNPTASSQTPNVCCSPKACTSIISLVFEEVIQPDSSPKIFRGLAQNQPDASQNTRSYFQLRFVGNDGVDCFHKQSRFTDELDARLRRLCTWSFHPHICSLHRIVPQADKYNITADYHALMKTAETAICRDH